MLKLFLGKTQMKNKKCLNCKETCKQEDFIIIVKCPHFRKKGVVVEVKKKKSHSNKSVKFF